MNCEYITKKQELETLYDKITDGIIVRSRAQWVEQGERSSKYFLSMEQQNKSRSVVRKLLIDGFEVTDQKSILNILKETFISKYTKSVNMSMEQINIFLQSVDMGILSENESVLCEGYITTEEVHKVLKSMKNNKTPGNDGITKELYLTLFGELGECLTNLYKCSF